MVIMSDEAPTKIPEFMKCLNSNTSLNLQEASKNFDNPEFIAYVIEHIHTATIKLYDTKKGIESKEKYKQNPVNTKLELISTPKPTIKNETFSSSTPNLSSQSQQKYIKSVYVNQSSTKKKRRSVNKNRSLNSTQDKFENSQQYSPGHRSANSYKSKRGEKRINPISQKTVFDISSSLDFPGLDGTPQMNVPVIKPILNSTNRVSRRITPTMVESTNTKKKEKCRLFGETTNPSKCVEEQRVSNAVSLKKERELLLTTRIFSAEKAEIDIKKPDIAKGYELTNISPIQSSEPLPKEKVVTCTEILSKDEIKKLEKFSTIYSHWVMKCFVPSIVAEIHNLMLMLMIDVNETISPINKSSDFEKLILSSVQSRTFAANSLSILASSNFLNILSDEAINLLQKFLSEDKNHHTLLAQVNNINKCQPQENFATYKNRNLDSILFQEETDGRSNFISDYSFHGFRKQRDMFYFIIREWNNKYQEGDFSKDFIGKLRWLINQIRVYSTFEPFLRLFLDHLMYVGIQKGNLVKDRWINSPHIIASSFPGELDRILKLENRVFKPNQSSSQCWLSDKCKFFKDFISIADSYSFNIYLCDSLKDRMKEYELLNCEIETQKHCYFKTDHENIAKVINSLRICGYFYGYTVCLPHKEHQDSLKNDLSHIEASAFKFVLESLEKALKKGHLLLTVPWIVQFLSQTSSMLINSPELNTLLHNLCAIYRSTSAEYLNCNPSKLNFFLTTSIGSLFELQLLDLNTLHQLLTTVSSTTLTLNQNTVDDAAEFIITQKLLYQMNFKLNEITTLLKSNCMVVNKRQRPKKIKPSSQKLPQSLNLQENLEMVFFQTQPLSLKNSVTFVSQRCQSNCIKYICSELLTNCFTTNEKVIIFLEELRSGSKLLSKDVIEAARVIYPDVLSYIKEKIQVYNCNQVVEAMKILIFSGTSTAVLDLAISICERMSMANVNSWLKDRLFGHVEVKIKYHTHSKTVDINPLCTLDFSMFLHSLRMSVIAAQRTIDVQETQENTAKILKEICEYFCNSKLEIKNVPSQVKSAIVLLTKELLIFEPKRNVEENINCISGLDEKHKLILKTILTST